MARQPKVLLNVEEIDEEMARTQARLVELARQKKLAMEAEADKGRATLLGALDKVKIGVMSKDDAKRIAKAFAKLGPVRIAEILDRH